MAWMSTLAWQNHDCPKCGEKAGNSCRQPSGRKCDYVHGERIRLLTTKEVESFHCAL